MDNQGYKTSHMYRYACAVVFALSVGLLTIPYGLTLGVLGWALPLQSRFALVKQWRRSFIFLERHILGINVRVIGLENIPDEPCVIVSNHQSAWETVGLQTYFSPCVYVLKKELLAIPFFGWGLASVKMIAIERQSTIDSLKKVTDQGKDRLARGISVIVFPEGTRSHPDDLLPFQIGGAFLAVKCNALVLPVTHNAGRVWPKGAFLKGPGTITVVIGKAIDPAGLRAQALNKMIELRIREQLAETERG